MAKASLSVIIPTYSGTETIEGVVDSIAKQPLAKDVDIIFVIDGPNQRLKEIIDSVKKNAFKSVKVKQFRVNKGRFTARYEGALLADTDKLLFIDDRTEMTGTYLSDINKLSMRHKVIISNILEKNHPNFISKTLLFIRQKLYKNWGKDFEPYDITKNNFDKSPKGTAGLCVERTIFLHAAKKFMDGNVVDTKSNDDTKLLKLMLEKAPLHKSPLPTLLYLPRADWKDEVRHIYKRGPMFIDYYLNKDSPYIVHLLILYVATLVILAGLFVVPLVITFLLVSGIILIILIAGLTASGEMRYKLGLGILLIVGAFIFGIYSGTISKLFNKRIVTRQG